MFKDIFIEYLPQLDLHGFDRETAIVLVKDFIDENYILKNKKIVVIHGRGTGVLKKAINDYLKTNKKVEEYHIDNFNDGMTIICLKVDKNQQIC